MKTGLLGLLSLIAFPLLAENQTENKSVDLTIVSWGGALQDAQKEIFFDPFQKESGKRIRDLSYNGGLDPIEEMLKKEKPEWDIVQVEAIDLVKGCGNRLFEALNWNKIGQRNEFVRGAVHNCGVGSILWAMVMAYDDAAFVDKKPENWKDFWDVQKFPGKRGLRKSARFTFEIALFAMGALREDVYSALRAPNASEAIFKKLDEIYPYIEWWEDGEQPSQWLQTQNVSMTSAYNGRMTSAIKNGNDFKMVWKDSIYSIDYWVILNNSPHKDASYQLLRFMTVPKKQAELADRISYAPPLKRSYRMIQRETMLMLPDVQNKGGNMFAMDVNFWAIAGDKLEAEFQEWLKKKTTPQDTSPKIQVDLPQSSAFVSGNKE